MSHRVIIILLQSKMVILPNKLKSKTWNFQLKSPYFKGQSLREQKVLLTDTSAECDKVKTETGTWICIVRHDLKYFTIIEKNKKTYVHCMLLPVLIITKKGG